MVTVMTGRTQQGYIQRVLLGIVLLVGKAEMQLKHIGINMDWSSEEEILNSRKEIWVVCMEMDT